MIEIKDLLLKFKDIILSNEVKKEIISEVIIKTIGIKIESKNIKIKNRTVFLDIKPIYKNEIFINKEKIQSEIRDILKNQIIDDIR